MVLGSINLHELLGHLVQRNIGRSGLDSRLGRGALGVHKELRRQQVGGVKHTLWDLWMVSTYVVFENTTPEPISKNHL